MRLGVAGRTIPARDFAIDDGVAGGVFGTPVAGVRVWGPEEGEHGRELAVEMGGEAVGCRHGGRWVEEPAEAGKQARAGHGEAWIGGFLTQMCARSSPRQVGHCSGKTLRMCSCPVRNGAVVCRSIDGRLRGPRSWWGACSAAA